MDVQVLMPAKLRCRTLFICVSASSVAAHYFPPELRASFEPLNMPTKVFPSLQWKRAANKAHTLSECCDSSDADRA
ncbi:hypothetical protein BZM26_11100 [Paraburkholderia strydomiana]|nr:hypothetical protein BZM26_11100 [Paraburkholderia strydomiana]